MWVFGYGSLMWDGWENSYGCLRKSIAVLNSCRRTFNKASMKNRGSKKAPCPTLSLLQKCPSKARCRSRQGPLGVPAEDSFPDSDVRRTVG